MKLSKKETDASIDSKKILTKIVKDYDIDSSSDFKKIINDMNESGGFEGRHLANGIST